MPWTLALRTIWGRSSPTFWAAAVRDVSTSNTARISVGSLVMTSPLGSGLSSGEAGSVPERASAEHAVDLVEVGFPVLRAGEEKRFARGRVLRDPLVAEPRQPPVHLFGAPD